MKIKIMLVAGARPNFVKIAPLLHELNKYKKHFSTVLVHTGQHYDFKMSEIFFKDLTILRPDIQNQKGYWKNKTFVSTYIGRTRAL